MIIDFVFCHDAIGTLAGHVRSVDISGFPPDCKTYARRLEKAVIDACNAVPFQRDEDCHVSAEEFKAENFYRACDICCATCRYCIEQQAGIHHCEHPMLRAGDVVHTSGNMMCSAWEGRP